MPTPRGISCRAAVIAAVCLLAFAPAPADPVCPFTLTLVGTSKPLIGKPTQFRATLCIKIVDSNSGDFTFAGQTARGKALSGQGIVGLDFATERLMMTFTTFSTPTGSGIGVVEIAGPGWPNRGRFMIGIPNQDGASPLGFATVSGRASFTFIVVEPFSAGRR